MRCRLMRLRSNRSRRSRSVSLSQLACSSLACARRTLGILTQMRRRVSPDTDGCERMYHEGPPSTSLSTVFDKNPEETIAMHRMDSKIQVTMIYALCPAADHDFAVAMQCESTNINLRCKQACNVIPTSNYSSMMPQLL